MQYYYDFVLIIKLSAFYYCTILPQVNFMQWVAWFVVWVPIVVLLFVIVIMVLRCMMQKSIGGSECLQCTSVVAIIVFNLLVSSGFLRGSFRIV